MDDSTSDDPAGDRESSGAPSNLTALVAGARSGLRSAVQALVDALPESQLLVALAQPIEGMTPGVSVEVSDSLRLTPHLLVDAEGLRYVALFTAPEHLELVASRMEWTTADGPLEYCGLPGPVAMELAENVVDGEQVVGLFLNPMSEGELFLQRHELGSLVQSRAVPLVGYVSQIPHDPGEEMLISELDGPVAADVVSVIEETLSESTPPVRFTLHQTFNAERDLEPHLTLNLISNDASTDLVPLAKTLAEKLEGKLPPPGYIDILFNDAKLR